MTELAGVLEDRRASAFDMFVELYAVLHLNEQISQQRRDYFLNKPYGVGGSRKAGDVP